MLEESKTKRSCIVVFYISLLSSLKEKTNKQTRVGLWTVVIYGFICLLSVSLQETKNCICLVPQTISCSLS